jgi:hypothetical protein
MRLTVGPLPAAVYWRRRAVVLAGLAIVVLIVSYACSATASPGADGGHTGVAAPTTTLPHPTTDHTKPTTTPPPTAFTLPPNTGGGDCTDTEIALSAQAVPAQAHRGQTVDFTIRIRNASNRTCVRDIGADLQELRLLDSSDAIVWSSDDCNPNTGHDPRTFAPGKEFSFTLTWSGRRSRSAIGTPTCTAQAKQPDPADYSLVARLGQKLSAPAPLTISA